MMTYFRKTITIVGIALVVSGIIYSRILSQEESDEYIDYSSIVPQSAYSPLIPDGISTDGSCVLPLASIEGQAMRLGGVDEGVKLIGDVDWAVSSEEISLDASLFPLAPTLGSSISQNVTIIVIDFFSTSIAIEDPPGVPHGIMVLNHTMGLLEAANDGSVSVVYIDISPGIDTASIRDALNAEMVAQNQSNGVTHFVVNMSFAIVPCDTIDAATYQAEVTDLAEYLRGSLFPTPDPLQEVVANACGAGFVVEYIAAAGNSGGNYALYPAAWDEVLAVGALELSASQTRNSEYIVDVAPYSNLGEVDSVGGWIRGLTPAGDEIVVRGTSFAAPTYSAYRALSLSAGGSPVDVCSGEIPGTNKFGIDDIPENPCGGRLPCEEVAYGKD